MSEKKQQTLSNKKAQPFLKWAGGKKQVIPSLSELIPKSFNQYIEPFVGGGALFFYLQHNNSIIGDSNEEIINCYKIVRDNVEELISVLKCYHYDKDLYYQVRGELPECNIKRAARTIFLNKTCFNGLFRVNKKGQFNVPFGKYKNPIICDTDRLIACSKALQGVNILHNHYIETLKYARSGDFLYLDPPYQPISKYSDFKRYTKDFFYEKDQIQLVQEVKRLVSIGCHVIVSNSDCEFIRSIYTDYKETTYQVEVNRHINKNPEGRTGIKELIIVCKS